MPGLEMTQLAEYLESITTHHVMDWTWTFVAMHQALLLTLAVVICGPICCAIYMSEPGWIFPVHSYLFLGTLRPVPVSLPPLTGLTSGNTQPPA